MKTKHKILIAEDNVSNMKLLRDVLEHQGFEVIETYDGKQALHKIKELNTQISLILMDIQLPEINGIEVIKEIKQKEATKYIPVFAVSAYAMQNEINKANEAGCDCYITKPINLKDFVIKVKQTIKD
ncbi:MAG: response regulator [bacterium]